MKKGIAIAGNMIVDTIHSIDRYPNIGELATISDNSTRAIGGALCNVIVDLAKLDENLSLTALGVVGDDAHGKYVIDSLSTYENIDLSQVRYEGTTSFTAVMSDMKTKQRTFFHSRGANATFSKGHINWDALDVDLLHIGYLLLLDELDKPDANFGTKMASLLATAQSRGIKTSIDMVSDSKERFKSIVPPALKYTNYCIINEVEAESTTDIPLRNVNGLVERNFTKALYKLKEMGVSTWVIVHAAEGAYGLDCESGQLVKMNSLRLPDGYIKGTNGAGDAFCSGVLYGAYRGKSLKESIELGICCATCSLSEPGATEGMRSYDEVKQLYSTMQ